MILPKYFCGDILLTRSDKFVSRAIRWFGQLQTGEANWSHAAMVLDGQSVIESLWRIRIRPIEKYKTEKYIIYRIPIAHVDRDILHMRMQQMAGNSYGITKIPLFALDGFASWINRLIFKAPKPCFFFTKTFGVTSFQVCSQFVVYCLHHFTGHRLLDAGGAVVDWRTVSPDYLEDLLKLPHNAAKIVPAARGDA